MCCDVCTIRHAHNKSKVYFKKTDERSILADERYVAFCRYKQYYCLNRL